MEVPPNPITPQSPPAEGGQFTWFGLVLALVAALAVGLIYAWIGQRVQPHFAPLILFPVLIGVFIGVTIIGVVRFARIGNRPTIVLSAVLAAAVAVGGQHYFSYLTYVSAYEQAGLSASPATNQDLSALKQKITPSFSQYLCAQARRGRPLVDAYVARGSMAWLTWAIDALLVAAAAVAVTVPAARVPYCNRCGTWYRTVRSGRLDVPTAQNLASLFGVEDIPQMRSPRYRLSACQSGCGSTRCELSWEESRGAVDLVCVWLSAPQRNQVAAILDGLSENDE